MGDKLKDAENRFTDPRRFSFKDGLAVTFTVVFLPMIIGRFFGYGDEWAIGTLADLMKIILGGYFVHEAVRLGTDAYQGRRDYNERPPI